jgi:hypothetical protein
MDSAESGKERLENHWRAKAAAAEIRYSNAPSSETNSTHLDLFKTFADLVLRHETPEDSR